MASRTASSPRWPDAVPDADRLFPVDSTASLPPVRIGFDFDNTIVCYDALFHRVALEDGCIPADLPANKSDVRNHLRAVGREDVWTEMQGRVYGARMAEAEPYPGVLEFFRFCREHGIPVCIVSHKTRTPFAGKPYDLHAAARDWLERQGFHDPDRLGLPRDRVFFELTKADKLRRIGECGCTHFIDDLPELLAEASFPAAVERILFDPNRLYLELADPRFRRLHRWAAAPRVVLGHPADGLFEKPAENRPETPESRFLVAHGYPAALPMRRATGGANNRVYHLRAGSRDLLLKSYFHSPSDPRDRFGAEHAFYSWAWNQGLRCLPEPLAWDPVHRLGLFEYIPGESLTRDEIGPAIIAQALEFVTGLNARRDLPEARAIPVASEACFSLDEHADRIGSRIQRLQAFQPVTSIDHEAAGFVAEELVPRWNAVREGIRARIAEDPAGDAPLPARRRCLSPSDFGFHNALLPDDGRVRFLDFEYAGWDDPAKLACDFFCQPRVPVPGVYWTEFVRGLDRALGWEGRLEARARLLLPAYRLKWCCIILNEFLRADRARREFARTAPAEAEDLKATQLRKAREYLAGA